MISKAFSGMQPNTGKHAVYSWNHFSSKNHFTLKQMQPYPLFGLGDLGEDGKGQ